MTAYVLADDCVPYYLYLCVRDQCSRTVDVLRLNYILCKGHTTSSQVVALSQLTPIICRSSFALLCLASSLVFLLLLSDFYHAK